MLNINAKLTGDLTAGLAKLEGEARAKILRAGAGAMSAVVYDEVKLNAGRHVKTGTMLRAVYQYHVTDQSGPDRQVYRVGVNRKKAPHWQFLEYGTSRAAASPIVRPAYDRIAAAIQVGIERMKQEFGQ